MSSPPTLFLNKHHEVLDSVKGFFGGKESMRLHGTHTHRDRQSSKDGRDEC